MSSHRLQPLDQPEVAPRPISARLRTQLVYFTDEENAPALGVDEFFLPADHVARLLDEGVFYLVSPLDTANMTEVELTEEQETFLQWLQAHNVQHVRLLTP